MAVLHKAVSIFGILTKVCDDEVLNWSFTRTPWIIKLHAHNHRAWKFKRIKLTPIRPELECTFELSQFIKRRARYHRDRRLYGCAGRWLCSWSICICRGRGVS